MNWKEFTTIGTEEEEAVLGVIRSGKLSGFIAGPPDQRAIPNGGERVRALEAEWCRKYEVDHAISFNSATTALMAACKAVGTAEEDHIITSPFTMSATVAAPLYCNAVVDFADIEPHTYCIDPNEVIRVWENTSVSGKPTRAVIAVNLFGHPAQLELLRHICEERNMFLIEDSAQTPCATEHDRISGTVGDIGVYSLNRHKHIHCGEGGMAVTNNEELAERLRSVRNHGINPLGLNLRMCETEAAIALCQLDKLDVAVAHARKVGQALSTALWEHMEVPEVREGCTHDYYLWTAKYNGNLEGIPHIRGYIQPLHKIFAGGQTLCPVVEHMREEVICFEAAKWDVDTEELVEAFLKAVE